MVIIKTGRMANFVSYLQLFDPSFEGGMELWSTLVPVISSEELDMGIFTT